MLAPGGRLLVVKGKLREGKDGHGLDTQEAKQLTAKLDELGYTDTGVDTIETGWRHEYIVVSAVKPT